MSRSSPVYLCMLILLALVAVAGCSSGGSTGDQTSPDGDADQDIQDIMDEDEPSEADLEDADKESPDGDIDEAVETDGDAGGDQEEIPEADMEAESEESAPPLPFTVFTSGGGTVSSENYRLKLFVAPVQPTGSASGSQYKIKLGPGGLQR